MTGFFAADAAADFPHFGNHRPFADFGAVIFHTERTNVTLQSGIGKHRRNYRVAVIFALLFQSFRQKGNQLFAGNFLSFFIADNNAVTVTVHRDSQMGMGIAHGLKHFFRVLRSAVFVDVAAVRPIAKRDHAGAEVFKHLRHNVGKYAVGTVKHHPQPFQRTIRFDKAFGFFQIKHDSFLVFADGTRPAAVQLKPVCGNQFFQPRSHLVGKFVAFRGDQFDAVVLIRIVRSRNHKRHVHAKFGGYRSHCRRRQYTELNHIDPGRRQSGRQPGFKHFTGNAGISPDRCPPLVAANFLPAGHSQFYRKFGGHRINIGHPAHPVGAEQFFSHDSKISCLKLSSIYKHSPQMATIHFAAGQLTFFVQ